MQTIDGGSLVLWTFVICECVYLVPYIEKQSHSTQSVNHSFKGEREQAASKQTSKRARASKHDKHKDEMQKNRAYAKPVL